MRSLTFPQLQLNQLGSNRKGGGTSIPSVLTFLFRDDFTDNSGVIANGATRNAAPGPGAWAAVNTNGGSLTVSSSRLNIVGQNSAGAGHDKLGLYDTGGTPITRAVGVALFVKLNQSSSASTLASGVVLRNPAMLHLNQAFGARNGIAHAIGNSLNGFGHFISTVSLAYDNPHDLSTEYDLVTILRNNGAFYLVKGGIYTSWTLMYVGDQGNTSTFYMAASWARGSGYWKNIRVIDLPGNGFSEWNDNNAGIVLNSASALTAGQTFSHTADFILKTTVTSLPASGTIQISFRKQDNNNYWRLEIASTGIIKLIRKSGGVDDAPAYTSTGVDNVANGMVITLYCDDSYIRHCLDDFHRNRTTDSSFSTQTSGAVESLGTGGVLTGLQTWASDVPTNLTTALTTVANY